MVAGGALRQRHAAGARAGRARILAAAEEKEQAAPEKKKVGLEKARAAALLAAREAVLGVLGKLAHHLAAVVGRWRGRLTGREQTQMLVP